VSQPVAVESAALLAALRGVAGVAGADLDSEGNLRLDLAPGADEVTVATAVGRILRDQFALAIDTDRLALVEEGRAGAGPGAGLRLGRLHLASSGAQVVASIEVHAGGRSATGMAQGPATADGMALACAQAAAAAASELIAQPVAVLAVSAGPAQVTVVLECAGAERVGRAAVLDDARQSAVRAVLAAIGS